MESEATIETVRRWLRSTDQIVGASGRCAQWERRWAEDDNVIGLQAQFG